MGVTHDLVIQILHGLVVCHPPVEVLARIVVEAVSLIDCLQLHVARIFWLAEEVNVPFGVFLLLLVGIVGVII